jgi:ELWxxDGT repeat protein
MRMHPIKNPRFAVLAGLFALLASSAAVVPPAAASDEVPVLVKDIEPGADGGSPGQMVVLGDLMVFVAETSAHGGELWVSDGTVAGTQLLKDINPGTAWSDPFGLTVIGDLVYFTADDGTNGYEPWVTDGTPSGTRLLKDIATGADSSFTQFFAALGSHVVFSAEGNPDSLWITDGTPEGTELLKTFPGSTFSAPSHFATISTASGDRVLFRATTTDAGTELWITDGTEDGTEILKDIWPNDGATKSSNPNGLVAIGDLVYFSAATPDTNQELWVSDGTEAGTRLVKDILVGTGGSNPSGFTAFKGKVYFTAKGELWVTDGTEAGTVLVSEVNPGVAGADIKELTVVGDLLFFSAYSSAVGADIGQELWVTDGTTGGTRFVKDINPNGFDGSDPQQLIAVGTLLYFTADDGTNGRELWVSDGTADGTRMVFDLNPGSSNGIQSAGDPERRLLVLLGGRLLFAGNDGDIGTELWALDVSIGNGENGNGENGNGENGNGSVTTGTTPATPVLQGGSVPVAPTGSGVWQQVDGSTTQLAVSASGTNQLRYSAAGITVTLTGGAGTSVANGLVANPAGEILCEVCLDLAAGNVVEVWMFSTPRLVAAHLVDAEPCQTFAIPLAAPLDGGGPVSAGAHTLQLALPTAQGMQAVNVGVTVGGLVPASVPAGEGAVPTPAWLLALGLLAAAGAVAAVRRQVVTD